MPEYALTLHFGSPDEEHARKRAEDIADLCAAEHGTRDPVLVPVVASELERLRAEQADMAQAAAKLVKLARNRADRFEAAIERVRAMHRQDDPEDPMCRHCSMTWPCPTARALDAPSTPESPESEETNDG